MALLLPLAITLVAHLATLAAMLALARAYDCDLYLPGGKSFDPRRQNRRLAVAGSLELLAFLWVALWLGQSRLGDSPLIPLLSSWARFGVPLLFFGGLAIFTQVGRHLSQFSNLRMTRPDGSVLLPGDIMRPLWLALNAHGSLLLVVPIVWMMGHLI